MVFARGPITALGNPELDPETAISMNLGVDQWFMKNFFMRLDGYYTQGEDFIGSRMIAENTYQNDNITKVQIYGADAELRYAIINDLFAYAGFTYNESTILEDEEASETEGNYLAFEPKNKGRLGITFDNPKYLTADLSANYVGRRYTDIENTNAGELDEYVSLDIYLARMIGNNTTVAVSGENLLDKRYKVYSLPSDESFAPGILIHGYLTFNF
jgi:iron complex outermembrane receptor protein